MRIAFTRCERFGASREWARARKFFGKARKSFAKAKKFPEKFDTFGLKRVMLEPERDVNASLQVMTGSTHDVSAFGLELQNRDHVTFFDPLPGIRRRLLNLDDDHVKLRPELPCKNVIVSNFACNFFA